MRRTHKEDFVRHITEVTEISAIQATAGLTAVFRALQMLMKSPTGREGEAWDIFSQLPKDLKRIWLAAADMPMPPGGKAEQTR